MMDYLSIYRIDGLTASAWLIKVEKELFGSSHYSCNIAPPPRTPVTGGAAGGCATENICYSMQNITPEDHFYLH